MKLFGNRQVTIYEPNECGEIVKKTGASYRLAKVEKVEIVDGEVIDESNSQSVWDNVWKFFFSHGATVGGNEWEAKHKRPNDGNGREYDGVNWQYTADAGGNANPCQCNYKAEQDYQGSVPSWDGYNGET